MREQLKADALAKLKASCPTLFSMGWFKENLPATTEEETAVEEAGSGDKSGGGEAAEDVATTDVINVGDEDKEGVTEEMISEDVARDSTEEAEDSE